MNVYYVTAEDKWMMQQLSLAKAKCFSCTAIPSQGQIKTLNVFISDSKWNLQFLCKDEPLQSFSPSGPKPVI